MRVFPFLYSHAHAREKRFSLFKERENENKFQRFKKAHKIGLFRLRFLQKTAFTLFRFKTEKNEFLKIT